jgi:hypothetical protein
LQIAAWKVVARMPLSCADVPGTMSLAVWSMTFRQNRCLIREDTPSAATRRRAAA